LYLFWLTIANFIKIYFVGLLDVLWCVW